MKREDMYKWNVATTKEYGVQEAISPQKQECEYTHINRINLKAGDSHIVSSEGYEMCIALVSGAGHAKVDGCFDEEMKKLDCVYLSADTGCVLTAREDCSFYVAFAKYEGIGQTHFIRFDPDTPLGDFHEIHGEGIFKREVFLMINDKTPASRLMCGYTFGGDACWTSWPAS